MDPQETPAPVPASVPALKPAKGTRHPERLTQREAADFVLRLTKALHAYGTPVHRLEAAMTRVADKLGLKSNFFCTPTAILVSFFDGRNERNHLIRVRPGEDNLEKLCAVDEITGAVMRGKLSPREGAAQLDEIAVKPARYGPWITALSFAMVSAAAARFFNGGIAEVLTAAGAGLTLGLLNILAAKFETVSRLFPALAAIFVSLGTAITAALIHPIATYVVLVSSVIVLIPGLTLTVAMAELATQHLVSGTARLMGAITIFLQLGFGMAIGGYLGESLLGTTVNTPPTTLPDWTVWVALALTPTGSVVLFQARPRDWFWAMGSGCLAYLGSRYGALSLGPPLGAFFGALMVGMAGNLFARFLDRPSSVVTVPGLLLLVPGSIGFRSMSSLLHQDVIGGMETAFSMVLVAIALVSGLLLSSLVIPPRKAL